MKKSAAFASTFHDDLPILLLTTWVKAAGRSSAVVDFLWVGSTLGVLVGLVHGVYLFQRIAPRAHARGGLGGKAQGIYYGLWALCLWTAFGSYVLALWIVGAFAYPIVHLFRGRKRA